MDQSVVEAAKTLHRYIQAVDRGEKTVVPQGAIEKVANHILGYKRWEVTVTYADSFDSAAQNWTSDVIYAATEQDAKERAVDVASGSLKWCSVLAVEAHVLGGKKEPEPIGAIPSSKVRFGPKPKWMRGLHD